MAAGRLLRGIGRITQALLLGLGSFFVFHVAGMVWGRGYEAFVLAAASIVVLGLAWVVGENA